MKYFWWGCLYPLRLLRPGATAPSHPSPDPLLRHCSGLDKIQLDTCRLTNRYFCYRNIDLPGIAMDWQSDVYIADVLLLPAWKFDCMPSECMMRACMYVSFPIIWMLATHVLIWWRWWLLVKHNFVLLKTCTAVEQCTQSVTLAFAALYTANTWGLFDTESRGRIF